MKYFYNILELDIPQGVYIPEEDSEMLAVYLENMQLNSKNFLEIGCGSGLLSIIAAKKGAHVVCVDINPQCIKATEKNAIINGVKLIVFKSDLFENVIGKYDIIVFNPPYLPTEEGEYDLTYSGGRSGRDVIEKFISDVGYFLSKNGVVLLLISSLTGEQECIEIFRKAGFSAIRVAGEKIHFEELILLEATK